MNVDALEAAIADDLARGVRPIAVIATGGSTNTGAIDDLAAIAGVCRRHDVWMHVDAAYGGPAILSDAVRRRAARARAGRQRRARSAQVAVRAGRSRPRAGARRRGDALRVQPGAALHPAVRQRRRRLRPAVVQRVRLPADARLPRAEGLDDDAAVRPRRVQGGDRGEPRAGRVPGRSRARRAGPRADGAAEPQRRLLPVCGDRIADAGPSGRSDDRRR